VTGLEQLIDRYFDWFAPKIDYLEIYSNYKASGDEKRAQFWMKVLQLF